MAFWKVSTEFVVLCKGCNFIGKLIEKIDPFEVLAIISETVRLFVFDINGFWKILKDCLNFMREWEMN